VNKKRLLLSGVLIGFFAWIAECQTLPAEYRRVGQDTITDRLDRYKGDDSDREASLFRMFDEAGCSGANLRTQPVEKADAPNVICTLPGETESTIIVGAHFDYVTKGDGVADNWSGASLLPSLYQSLNATGRKHTFLFIGFSDEEVGFLGSTFYADHLTDQQLASIRAMITIDTLGLENTRVWASDSAPDLVSLVFQVGKAAGLPVEIMNVDAYGNSDGISFKRHGVPVLTLHSVTPETIRILHSERDRIEAINMKDYYDSYNLIASFLAALDQSDASPEAGEQTSTTDLKE
jgi:hypothetical protein